MVTVTRLDSFTPHLITSLNLRMFLGNGTWTFIKFCLNQRSMERVGKDGGGEKSSLHFSSIPLSPSNMYIEMVWATNKIYRTCKDGPTGHDTRRDMERQTEKEMGR